jgi:hypothetical protein
MTSAPTYFVWSKQEIYHFYIIVGKYCNVLSIELAKQWAYHFALVLSDPCLFAVVPLQKCSEDFILAAHVIGKRFFYRIHSNTSGLPLDWNIQRIFLYATADDLCTLHTPCINLLLFIIRYSSHFKQNSYWIRLRFLFLLFHQLHAH